MWRLAREPALTVALFTPADLGVWRRRPRSLDGAANQPSRHSRTERTQEYVANKPTYYFGMDSAALYLGSFQPPRKLSFKGHAMRNSTAILATVALGAVLAIGSATASMARGSSSSDHGRGFGGGPSSESADAGDHAYGATIPFMTNNGASLATDHGFSFRHGFGGSRRVGGYRGHDSVSPYASGPLFWLNPYTGR
jgi:hypothetical protein